MSDRPPFEASHNSICCYPDIPILDFYNGYFESVYIILHPFLKATQSGVLRKIVTWQEFRQLAGFKDIKQLDIALRNYIGGLKGEYKNEKDAEAIRHTLDEHCLLEPTEGEFQDALTENILLSLKEQGHSYMFIGDEHGFERKAVYIDDILKDSRSVKFGLGGHENWYTINHEILFTSHWDSFFTLLCSDRATIESVLTMHPFEGFYCDASTQIYWSLH